MTLTHTDLSVAGRRRQVSPRLAWWWRHPETPWGAVVGSAWVALTIWHYAEHGAASTEPWRFDVVAWTLMVVAMMLPGVVPMMRQLAFGSLWRRRHRTPLIFAATFVAGWVMLGVAAAAVVAIGARAVGSTFDPGSVVVATSLGLAAWWQLTGWKKRNLRRCHLTKPVTPSGWRGDWSVVRYAGYHLRVCAGSCGAIMAVMFVSHDFHVMAPLATVSIVERFQNKPNERAGAAALAAVAALVVLT